MWLGTRCALFELTRACSFSHRHGYRVGIPHNLLSSTYPSVSVASSSFSTVTGWLALVDLVLSLRAITQHGANHPPHIHDAAGEAANAALMITVDSRRVPATSRPLSRQWETSFRSILREQVHFYLPTAASELNPKSSGGCLADRPSATVFADGEFILRDFFLVHGPLVSEGRGKHEKPLTERIAFVRHCWIWGGSNSREHNSLAKPTEYFASMCFSIPRKAFVGTDAKCRNT